MCKFNDVSVNSFHFESNNDGTAAWLCGRKMKDRVQDHLDVIIKALPDSVMEIRFEDDGVTYFYEIHSKKLSFWGYDVCEGSIYLAA
jgi:hypothetical protein